jgi:cobalt/nickel transport system permease protein
MHIEPGILLSHKVIIANIGTLSLIGMYLRHQALSLQQSLHLLCKIILAALFFSLFMQSFHAKVGYSELHFIGASLIYFTFGFIPTLFGFALGLLLQGVLFEPQDLYHLGVNSLSLMLPLMLAHYSFGRKITEKDRHVFRKTDNLKKILSFDTLFHGGVIMMIGFWLLLGEETVVFDPWMQFAVSYVPVVLLDSVFAWVLLNTIYQAPSPHPLLR